ncbi:terminase large subunit [Sulfitobacter sp. S190]|uniref:terminase large subunit n=1 Tax=Sulfitobacter sp. S190 TaxID=2867022 RepID=UPI0021A58D1D|nr:terminase TerL endonuclease subunit [Sulfitobacter sp. S190]UWR22634.1 terminase large subunit [Sulfitobacter sp. S190]
MGQRGKGAKPKLSVVSEQGAFGFAQHEVSALRSVLPWEEPDLSRVERVGAFLEDLPITQGSLAGSKLVLRDWQWNFLEAVYGEDETGRRPVRTAVLSMARKNGKTQLVAGLGLCHLLGPEAESRGEVYAAANDKTQSGKTFAEMVAILDEHPELDARCNVVKFSKRIEVLSGQGKGSIFAALSADASTKQGLSPSFTIYDELGTAPKRDLYEALDTAMGARDNPLLCVISTQAASDHAVMSELIDYGKKINAGEVEDPSFHLTFYGADMDDDPWSEATWLKANPALGDFRSLDDVQRQAAQAKRMPAAEQGFRNLILNQRVDAHVRFLAKAEWDANGGAVDFESLVGRTCYGGLDLSQSRDLTAFVMVFPDGLGSVDVLPQFFLPENGIREKSELDRVPYDIWAKQGFLRLIPGSVVDPGYVAEAIAEACDTYNVQRIAYDKWRIQDLKRELARMGSNIPLEPFAQSFREMAPAVDKLERMVAEAKLRHAENPLLTYCASNSVVEMDNAGNRKLAKNKSSGRIDGMVALAMALAAIDREEEEAMPACLAELME